MNFFSLFFTFLFVFFSLQLFFGKAGILTFIQERNISNRLEQNVNVLENINQDLEKTIHLAETNREYLQVFAHRVGLVSEDEYYIYTETPIFFETNTYSPGALILNRGGFFVSNGILFFISVAFECVFVSLFMWKKNVRTKRLLIIANQKYEVVPKKQFQAPAGRSVALAGRLGTPTGTQAALAGRLGTPTAMQVAPAGQMLVGNEEIHLKKDVGQTA